MSSLRFEPATAKPIGSDAIITELNASQVTFGLVGDITAAELSTGLNYGLGFSVSDTLYIGIASHPASRSGHGLEGMGVDRRSNSLVPVEDGNHADSFGISTEIRHSAPKSPTRSR